VARNAKPCVRKGKTQIFWARLITMRRGAASSLLADCATPDVVQRQLRHSDARITLGITAMSSVMSTAVLFRIVRQDW
jgi:hypothetical protein